MNPYSQHVTYPVSSPAFCQCKFRPLISYLIRLDNISNKSRHLLNISHLLGFPGGSVEKNLPASAGDVSLIPGLGRSRGRGNGNSFQYFCQDNPMDGGTWWVTVHVVAKESHTAQWLNNSSSYMVGTKALPFHVYPW